MRVQDQWVKAYIAESCFRANTFGVQIRTQSEKTAHNIIAFYELRRPCGSANFKGEGYESSIEYTPR